jgi:hypothetical protein
MILMKVKVEFRLEDDTRKIRMYRVQHEPDELVDYFEYQLDRGFEVGDVVLYWEDIKYFKITPENKEIRPITKRKIPENKALIEKRKAEGIAKLGGKCSRCGAIEKLQFDHVDPQTKSFNMASSWTRSEEQIQEELEKCQLLCELCHMNKTLKERREARHGTIWRYKQHKCRCEYCTAAMRERWRKDNEKRKDKSRWDLFK